MLYEVKSGKRLTKDKIVVGMLSYEVITFLHNRGVEIHTKEIYINHKGLSHLARDSKNTRGAGLTYDDILKIPDILKEPSYVYFDKNKTKLNLKIKKSVKKLLK